MYYRASITYICSGFVTAWRTLTVVRIPGREAGSFADALLWFPLVGALLGGLMAAVCWAVGACAHWTMMAGIAGAGMLALLTGGLHLDGLADGADGLYGNRTPARRLEIMKDPRVGAMGVVAIVFVVLLKTCAMARLAESGAWSWLVLPVIWSRTGMAVLAASMPYARAAGEGTARGFVSDARPVHAIVAVLLALAISLPLAPEATLVCAVVGAALVFIFRRVFQRAVGGITGDLLGFSCECVEVVLFIGLALAACRT